MSSFDYCPANDDTGRSYIAISKERYSLDVAIEIARYELGTEQVEWEDGYAYYGFGVNADGERSNNWWFDNTPRKRSVAIWMFKGV